MMEKVISTEAQDKVLEMFEALGSENEEERIEEVLEGVSLSLRDEMLEYLKRLDEYQNKYKEEKGE